MRSLLSTWLLLAALFLFPTGLFAGDDGLTRLRIEVTTLQNRPLDQASVIVKFVEGRAVTKLLTKIIKNYEMRTNREGVVNVPALPRGKITIQVIAKGYQTYGQVIEAEEPEKTIKIQLKPPQTQYSSHQ